MVKPKFVNMKEKIRKMTIEDYGDVFGLWNKTKGMGINKTDSKKNIAAFLKKNGPNIVYEENEKIIGTVLCGNDGRRGYIYHLAVHKDNRRKGIGKRLVAKCVEKLKNKGIAKCHAFIFCNNKIGINFWNKIGWEKRNDIFIFSKKI